MTVVNMPKLTRQEKYKIEADFIQKQLYPLIGLMLANQNYNGTSIQ